MIENMVKAWIEKLKDKNLYKMATVGALFNLLAVIAIGLAFLIPGIFALKFGSIGIVISAILAIVWFVIIVYVQQIGVGLVLAGIEGEKSIEKAFNKAMDKIIPMGSAYLLAQIAGILVLSPGFVGIAMGIMNKSLETTLIGTAITLIALIPTLIIGYLFMITQVIAYKENKGFVAVKESALRVTRKIGDTAVFFIILVIVASVVSGAFSMLGRVGISFGVEPMLVSPGLAILGVVWYFLMLVVSSILSFALYVSGQYTVYEFVTEKPTRKSRKPRLPKRPKRKASKK